MKPLVLLPLVLIVSGGTAAVTAGLVRNEPAEARAQTPDDSADLVGAVHALEQRIAELARDNERLRLELSAVRPTSSPRTSAEDVEAVVARVLREHGLDTLPAVNEAEAVEAATGSGFDANAALLELLDDDLSEMKKQELWARYAKEGKLDELVALFEERAAADPNDPDAQVDLGGAYLQKVFAAGGGPMAGKWAMKADGSFDTALALDERHWEARFSKATSLSFWPPALGKQGEAIRHFEILMGQQEEGPRQPQHAQTYLMLGNTYQQIGDAQKARATWERGLSLFPDEEALRKQVELAGTGG